jgi:hypothetical protein
MSLDFSTLLLILFAMTLDECRTGWFEAYCGKVVAA